MDLTRQTDLISSTNLIETNILCVGAGGIGSFTVNALAKMGFENIEVWDRDVLESHNIPNQDFDVDQVGEVKVAALANTVMRRTGTAIDIQNDFWYGDFTYDPDIVITGVDSMGVRKEIWEKVKESPDKGNRWFIDARMSSKNLSIYTTRLDDEAMCKRYEETLYDDSEAIQEPCTARAIIHIPLACAYSICQLVHQIVENKQVTSELYANLNDFKFITSDTLVS